MALGRGFQIWDFYNKTKYSREFQKITKDLYEEMAKPIYPPDGEKYHYKYLRNQAKIDELQLDLVILMKAFNKEVAQSEYLNTNDI